jgi:putative ABC transport system permease protein
LLKLVLKNLEQSTFKTWLVSICAALVAMFAVAATIVLGGARQSLDLAMQRLGADIIVVPAGVEQRVENALLMGAPVRAWMPAENLARLREIAGVEVATPQVYLATLRGATCCTLPEMFLIAYDPETDFTVRPWLEQHGDAGLALGEAVGGAFVYVPAGEPNIKLYGYPVDLRGNLEQTGAGLDQTMFLTMATAQEIAATSITKGEQPLVIERDSISAVLIRLAANADPAEVSQAIRRELRGVTPIESASLFGTQRKQMNGLMKSIFALLLIVWALAVGLTGVVFSLAVEDRRREMGMLRALGAPRTFVAGSLLGEVAVLAFAGSLLGASFAALAIYLFRNAIIKLMAAPFLYPAPLSLLGLILGILAVTLVSVLLAVIWPTLRVSFQEPAYAMRE